MARSKAAQPAPGIRRCVGSKTFGIAAHDAPVGNFPAQPSQKDGLGRMCKAHWTEYTGALRKAALARKAAGQDAPAKPPKAKAQPTTTPAKPRQGAKADVAPVIADAPRVVGE